MKIENTGSGATPTIAPDAATAKASRLDRSAGVPTKDKAADEVQSSPIAKALQPDTAKLERLREAVQNGTYSIPAAEVSARIIEERLSDSQ